MLTVVLGASGHLYPTNRDFLYNYLRILTKIKNIGPSEKMAFCNFTPVWPVIVQILF